MIRTVYQILLGLVLTSGLSVRYRARVAYDGTNFQGFQIQLKSDKRTVQSVLEEALGQRLNQPTRVVGASRTDTGVHSRGQLIHFDVDTEIDEADVQHSVERMLPNDVAFWDLERAPQGKLKVVGTEERNFTWNALYDSSHKLYSYRLSLAPVMDPIERRNRWHPDLANNYLGTADQLQTFERLLKAFEGDHDFRPFAGALEQIEKRMGGKRLNTVRTVHSVVLVDEGSGNYRIDFLIKGALYKQIRNMVGTVMSVCRGELQEEQFFRLLANLDYEIDQHLTRVDNPCRPAPPFGLTLEYVHFDDASFDVSS